MNVSQTTFTYYVCSLFEHIFLEDSFDDDTVTKYRYTRIAIVTTEWSLGYISNGLYSAIDMITHSNLDLSVRDLSAQAIVTFS